MNGWKKTRGRLFDSFKGLTAPCPQCGALLEGKKGELRCKTCDVIISATSRRNKMRFWEIWLGGVGLLFLVAFLGALL